MKKFVLLYISILSVTTSCTVTLGEDSSTLKPLSEKERLEQYCKAGEAQACELLDLIQKKEEERMSEIIKRNKGK